MNKIQWQERNAIYRFNIFQDKQHLQDSAAHFFLRLALHILLFVVPYLL